MSNVCYFDYAAATPLDERVLLAMQPYLSEQFYNPSSPYAPAVAVRRAYEAAKQAIARTIGAHGDELVMTAGATESINLAMQSIGGHIICPATEHESVRHAVMAGEYTIVAVGADGRVDPAVIARAVTPHTRLVSAALANHEIGTIQPIADIAAVLQTIRQQRQSQGDTTPLLLHCDASQGCGLIDVHVARLGVDLLTLNAAKVYGPKQVGLLWVKPGVKVRPQVHGGGQELGLRSGTENVAGVIGFAEAMRLAEKKRKGEVVRLRSLRDAMEQALTDALPMAIVSGSRKHRLANFLHISFPKIDAERLIFMLETKGVLVATGSACAAAKGTGSAVLAAIGMEPEVASGSLRITLGRPTTKAQCDMAVAEIIAAVQAEYARMGVAI
ncbi:MAG: cysteine desulfurase family protein [Candidatus Saccharibacteria bacterium]|nr:cysteine desulfurase family protein [Candidatus Saccharibacteria bacterium]